MQFTEMHVFIGLCFLSFLCCVNCTILNTKQGSLKGDLLTSRGGRTFHAFYGIPYAEPPIGNLRFKDPVPAKTWEGVRNATVLPPMCLSIEPEDRIFGQEDCLYLNVYTPKLIDKTSMPVIVFIYGGNFMLGHALPSRYGPHYFMDEDVVLVTFHYRLGIFGFLSTEDEVIPGNYGLKDVVAVLKWVRNYIHSFGGDKNRVTLQGGSSGGAMVALCLISPLTKGLFHRAISQSGFPEVTPVGGSSRNTWKLASMVGCDSANIISSEMLLTCLRNISAETLVKKQLELYYLAHVLPKHLWAPVIENERHPGAFIVDEPDRLIRWQKNIPWIIGMNADDGAMIAIILYFNPLLKAVDRLDRNYRTYFPLIFKYADRCNDMEEMNLMTDRIKNHYFGNTEIRDNVQAFAKMVTTMQYIAGIRHYSLLYRGPVYVYYYGHKNQATFAHDYGDFNEDMGVVHGDELISFFNWSESIPPVTKGMDFVVSKQLIQLWTNFAAKGNPNTDKLIWEPVNSPKINYLHIENGKIEMRDEFQRSEREFLNNVGFMVS